MGAPSQWEVVRPQPLRFSSLGFESRIRDLDFDLATALAVAEASGNLDSLELYCCFLR